MYPIADIPRHVEATRRCVERLTAIHQVKSSRRRRSRNAVLYQNGRGRNAVAALVALQEEYRDWLDRLPESLEGSPTAEKLQAITEIDLDD